MAPARAFRGFSRSSFVPTLASTKTGRAGVLRTLDSWWLAAALAALLTISTVALAQPPSGLTATGTTQPNAASPPPAPDLSHARLQGLIDTLQDPTKRDQLIANLRALEAAQAEQQPSAETNLPDDVVTSLLAEITARTNVVRRVSVSIIDSLDQIPLLVNWLQTQASDPALRSLWLHVGLRVATYLGLAILAYVGVAVLLRPACRSLVPEIEIGMFDRVLRSCIRLLLDLVPVLAFAIAVFATIAVVEPSAEARAVVVPLIHAVILAQVAVALARMIFGPKTPRLRLLPVSDASAASGFRWLRRLTSTTIYGCFALEAGRQLGLPWTIHGFLLHLLFFVILVMVMTIIVQSRVPVAAAIASLAEEPHSRVVRRLPWRSLASIWHLLAFFYVLFLYSVWALDVPGGLQLLFGATLGSAVIGVGCWLALRVIDHLFGRDLPLGQEAEAALPGFDSRIKRYLPIMGGVLRILVWLGAIMAMLQVWGFGALSWLLSEAGQNLSSHLLIVAVVVVVTIVIWEVFSLVIERTVTDKDDEGNLRLSNRARTLLNITRSFLLVFLSLIALFLILSELGLNIAPLLAGAGVIGLAIGFGSQRLVQDIITGLFVLLGDTMRVGDVVEVASRTGVVEEMTMRTVVLREYSGKVHTIPYNSIDTVTNYTKDYSYAVFDIGVAYRESVDRVMEVLREIGGEMNRDSYFRRLILEPLEVAGVDKFGDSAVIIKARIKTRPLKQWEVSREFNRRVKNRFDELGIEIPFPHQTIYFGADKEGNAPPAMVRLETPASERTDRIGDAAAAQAAPAEAPREGTTERRPQPVLAPSRSG
jgi:small-conductance mechanosensitive channel